MMTGCDFCGVGPEDECTMDCPSRDRDFDSFDGPYSSDLVNTAWRIAVVAHEGQTRKYTDEPYVEHCMRVAHTVLRSGAEPWVIAAALLHDVIEDTEVTPTDLLRHFDKRTVDLVVTMTRPDWEPYAEYIARICHNEQAWLIKRSDLLDNMATLPKGDRKMVKYTVALDMLAKAATIK